MIEISVTEIFVRLYRKLPVAIREKADAKTGLSLENVKIRLHRAKKMAREVISNFV